MKKLVWLLLLIMLPALCLAACGEVDISGSYKLVSMNAGAYDWDMDESLTMLDDIILTVDGETATLTLPEETVTLTVDLHELTMTDEDGFSSPYVYEEETATLTLTGSSGSVMVFEKIVSTPDEISTKQNKACL